MNEILSLSKPQCLEHPPCSRIFKAWINIDKLLDKLKLPDIQREIDLEWVQTLKTKILEQYNKKGYFNFDCLHLCCLNESLYLINGQHRYMVLQDLVKEYPNIIIEIKIESVDCYDDLNKLFMISNGSRQAIICKNSDEQLIINIFKKHMTKKYPNYLSNAQNPHKPNINLGKIVTKFKELNIIDKLNLQNPDDLIMMVEKINDFYRRYRSDKEKWASWKIRNPKLILDKIINKNCEFPLFLGIYSEMEWIEKLLYCEQNKIEYELIEHFQINYKRRKVSNKVRNDVWFKRNNEPNGCCYVCNNNLHMNNFEVGHILAVFYGGQNNIRNLEPICGDCNRCMGIMNLEEYKKNINN